MIAKFLGSKLDHGIFFGFVIVFALSVVSLLIYMQFFWKGPSVDDIIVADEKPLLRAKVKQFPVKLHVVGKVDETRLGHVRGAITDWGHATGGMVKVTLVSDWTPPSRFNIPKYKTFELRTLWFLDPDDDNVALLLVNSDGPVTGASEGNFIVLIDGPEMKNGSFLRVVMKHELGHLLGLVHLREGNPGLMLKDPGSRLRNNPTAQGQPVGHIGKLDLLQFCTIYECPDGVR